MEQKIDSTIKKLLGFSSNHTKNIGFTEHGIRHSKIVAKRCELIIKDLGYDNRMCELAYLSGLLHDIGNSISRKDHPYIGSILAFYLMTSSNYSYVETLRVASAVGNHNNEALNELSAALFIADKSDMNRSRLQKDLLKTLDDGEVNIDNIHNRVNYSIIKDDLYIDKENRYIILELETMDKPIARYVDFFEIYGSKLSKCEKAAKMLNATYNLIINGNKVI